MRNLTIFFVTIISIAILGATIEAKHDKTNWNSGICEECGGEFNLNSVYHIKNLGDTFVYECDTCGRVIETHGSMR